MYEFREDEIKLFDTKKGTVFYTLRTGRVKRLFKRPVTRRCCLVTEYQN